MENRRKEMLKKYMIHYDNIEHYNLLDIIPVGSILCMDTESCYKYENNVPEKIFSQKQGKMIENPDFNFEVHCYAWGVSNSSNDYVVYGENLKDMFSLFEKIGNSRKDFTGRKTQKKLKEVKKNLKMKCFVHNLGWDVEFMKYVLHDLNYKYTLSSIDEITGQRVISKKTPITYNIVESDNIVYSCDVNFGDYEKHEFKCKQKGKEIIKTIELFTQVQFIDSFKIMAQSLDSIAKNVIKIDEMYYKMGATYDYNKIRPVGHKLDYIEKAYLYNDVYILKEFVKQFYIPLDTQQTTASSIAFEKFIKGKFGDKGSYKAFTEVYPDLYDYKKVYEIIKDSYKGGWTQANKKYVGKEILCDNAVSIDINSSYPAVVRYKPLPYGEPKLYKGKKELSKDELAIYTIHFDGFKNNNDDDLIGQIQCGALNTNIFNCNGTEYLHTNFIKGEMVGTNKKSNSHNYKLSIWNFELENMLENMSFYEYEKEYNKELDIYYNTDKIKKGFTIESSLVFKCHTGFFGEQVDNFTKMKIEGKLEGNNAKTSFAKLCLNSFYGKLASNPERMERDLIFNEEGMATFENTDIAYLSEKKYYPAFSSCVTAWARVNLRSTLYKIGYNNVLYFDTDSLYTTVNADYIKNKCGDILHPTELGKWDIEKEYNKFKAIGAKKYIYNGRDYGKNKDFKIGCKCAGLPADVRAKATFETFYLGNTFTGKKSKKRVKGGYTLLEGEYKLNLFTY